MNRTRTALASIALSLTLAAAPARAQDPATLEEIKDQLRQATEMLKQQQSAIEALQRKLAEVEAKSQAEAPAPQAPPQQAAIEALEKRLAEMDAKSKSAAPAAGDAAFSVAWKDHRTTFTMPNFELQFYNMLQPRYTYTENGDPAVADAGSFRMRRARSYLAGWAGRRELSFYVQYEWAGNPTLLDAYINYDFTGGKKYFTVRAGQFKVPFGRQILTGDGNLEFTDRSLASDFFTHDRDLGVMVHGQFGTAKVRDMVLWSAGIFNGNGRNRTTNDNAKYQTDARLVFSPWGSTGYTEGNMEGFDTPRLSVAASYENNDQRVVSAGALSGTGYHMWGADLSFKWRRLSAYYEVYDRRSYDALDQRWSSDGYTAQVGVFAIPKKLEVALRTSRVDPDRSLPDNVQGEDAAAVTWYIDKHNHKLVLEYRDLDNEALKYPSSHEWRFQWQFVF